MGQNDTYFLIGGAGFMGSFFSDYLKKKGINVTNVLRGELSDANSIEFNESILKKLNIGTGQNIIVDFAYTSVPNTSFNDPVKDFTENLYNINCHLAFALKLPNVSYIYISSGGTVYGNVKQRSPISEEAENRPLSPYGITKLACEKYVLMYKEIYGLDAKIIRPSNVYGPGQKPFRGQGFIATALAKIVQNEEIQIFGDGSNIRDYIYISDFSEILYEIINAKGSGDIYNIGSEKGYSTNDILAIIKKLYTKDIVIEYLPDRPFDVTYNVLDSSKIKSSTRWEAKVSIEEGLESTLTWIKSRA